MRVVIVEDHPLMLSAIRETLEQADGFAVVGTANSGLQVEPLVSRTRPDLVLLDLHLPGLDGLSCLALLRERHPQATVVVCSGVDDEETVQKALLGGATAFVNKSITPADLPPILRQARKGTVHFAAPQVAPSLVTRATRESQFDGRPRRDRAHGAGARDPRSSRARPFEPRRRQRAVPLRPDREVPPEQDLPQAPCGESHRSGEDRLPARARPGPHPRGLARVLLRPAGRPRLLALELLPVLPRRRPELDHQGSLRPGLDLVWNAAQDAPGISRTDLPRLVADPEALERSLTRTPICSFGWLCSGTTLFGASSRRPSVTRSPWTARTTTPSQIFCGETDANCPNALSWECESSIVKCE